MHQIHNLHIMHNCQRFGLMILEYNESHSTYILLVQYLENRLFSSIRKALIEFSQLLSQM
jgi:hypothetical protein